MPAETPESMMTVAKILAQQLLGLTNEQKLEELTKLKKENEPLYSLVRYQLKRIARAAKGQEIITMATEGDTPRRPYSESRYLHFDKDGKLYTLEIQGMEYNQTMATGELFFDKLLGDDVTIKKFYKVFSIRNKEHLLIVVDASGVKKVFQPPISLATINSTAKEKSGKIVLNRVLLKFAKEVVTLRLNRNDDDLETDI